VAGLLDALQHLEASTASVSRPWLDRLLEDLATGRVTAPRDLLREVLLVAIDEAAETLNGYCTRLLRGGGSIDEVRAGLAELTGLVDLLERLPS
jgi:hypothetical protein